MGLDGCKLGTHICGRKMAKRYKNKREDPGYEEFRQAVLKRDKHKCQMPGCTRKTRKWLQVHHIVPYSVAAYLRTDPDNGITLWFGCHKRIGGKETYYGRLFLDIVKRNKDNER